MAQYTLSNTGLKAVDLARRHGGELHRQSGGFWVGKNDVYAWNHNAPQRVEYIGTRTVEALEKRRVLERRGDVATLTQEWK